MSTGYPDADFPPRVFSGSNHLSMISSTRSSTLCILRINVTQRGRYVLYVPLGDMYVLYVPSLGWTFLPSGGFGVGVTF